MSSEHADFNLPVGARPRSGVDLTRDATPHPLPSQVEVAIIGAGVIGLSIGWLLARRGLSVAVFERAAAGAGTSAAATGMLAAAAEHETGATGLLALCLESQKRWLAFRSELESASGVSIDYRNEGTLVVALGREEVDRLRFRHESHKRAGIDSRWLNGTEVRGLEPGLRAAATAGIFCGDDHQVDPRCLVAALTAAFRASGGRLMQNCPVTSVETSGGAATGVLTSSGACRARIVVLAAGVWSNDNLLPAGLELPLRPLKGQALLLRSTLPVAPLSHVVWTEQVHLAPKRDGRLIVGATQEDAGFNATITAGGVLALLSGVHRALPSSEEMEIEAVWSGFRPTTEDDAPVLGETNVAGLLVAAGHHRNGILLAPVTAWAIEELITTGETPAVARPFSLQRFERSDTNPTTRKQADDGRDRQWRTA